MKQNLRFIFMTLLCAVFSTAWGETATLTNANIVAAGEAAGGYTGFSIKDDNGKTWNAYAIKNKHSNATSDYHYLQIKKNDNNGPYYIQVPEFGSRITSIKMTVSSTSKPMTGGGNTASLYFSNSNITSAEGDGVASGTGESSVTIDCSSLNLNTGYITADGAVRIWDIEVTYSTGTTPSDPIDPTVSFGTNPLTVIKGSTASNTINKPSDLTVTYSSGNTAVATVDASTGEVTGVEMGETTITATWAAVENKYNAGSASYTVNVIEAPQSIVYEKVTNKKQLVAGNEYIVAVSSKSVAMGAQVGTNTYRSAVEIQNTSDTQITVASQDVVKLTLGGDDKGWTFLASDNNKYLTWSSGNSLDSQDEQAYWTVESDNNGFYLCFASTPERILQYNSTNPRFACYTSSQTKAYLYVKEGSAVDNKEEATVSIDKTQLALNATATITTDPETLVVSYESSDAAIAEVSSTGIVTAKAEGTATITATWEEQTINEVIYKAGSETFSIKVKDPINGKGSLANPYTVAEVLDYNGTINGVWVKGYIVGFYNNSGFNPENGDAAETTNIALFDNKSATESDETIAIQLPNTFIRSSLNLKDNAGMLGEEVLVYGNIEKYFGVNGLKGTTDGYIILPEIGSTGYSTTYYTADLKVQEGTEAFAVTGNGNQLTYTSVGDVIPAGVAVVLKGNGPQKFQIVSAPTMTTDFTLYENNNLKGLDVAGVTVGPDNGSYVYYKLAVGTSAEDEGVVGFYWAVANGAAFNSKAHKAYLVLPASGQEVSSYAFDETVGISSPMLNEIKTEGVYTLSGVRVMSDCLPKGIYIVNGKKMVIK